MENCLNAAESYYKDIEEYKTDVDNVIEQMVTDNERLVFAIVAERSGVTRFVVRRYPELRNYILQKIVYYKEMQVINQKIDKAVSSLIKTNKSLTLMSIMNKCNLGSDVICHKEYIKDKIRRVLAENKQIKE